MSEQELEKWEKLDAYLRDELSAAERSQLEAQLAADEQLRLELEITRAEHVLAELAWEDSFRGKVRHWIDTEEGRPAPAPPKSAAPPLLWMIGVALLLVCATTLYYSGCFRSDGQPATAPHNSAVKDSLPGGVDTVSREEKRLLPEKERLPSPFCDSAAARKKFEIYYKPQLAAGATNAAAAGFFALRDSFNQGAYRAVTAWKVPVDTADLYGANLLDLQGRALFHEREYTKAGQHFAVLLDYYTRRKSPNEEIGAARKYMLTLQAACETEVLRAFCRKILRRPGHPLTAEARAILERQ